MNLKNFDNPDVISDVECVSTLIRKMLDYELSDEIYQV